MLVDFKHEIKLSDKTISFIIPSRSNLKYLKWGYEGIRKHLGYRHELCYADDASTDGTWEWLQELAKKDQNVKIHRNVGPDRLGHTILYDTLINEVATNDIVMIFHADMLPLPGLDDEILKHIKPGVVVSATRIEPPLHPDGPEKVLMDFGIEPEEFKEQELLNWYNKDYKPQQETTEGIFAPWAIYKKDFQSINGHDPLYAPQSKEDSDIFNRFILAGYKVVQTRKGAVYHMTCRGSRFADGAARNPDGEVFMKNRETDEWLIQNERSTRNFARKWSSYCMHDDYLKPYIQPKYDIGYVVENCDMNGLIGLEPWSDNMYIQDKALVEQYIKDEQPNTSFDLKERLLKSKVDNNIIVKFDLKQLRHEHFEILNILPEIIRDSGVIGEFELEIFNITIKDLQTYEQELIKCNTN